MRIISGKAKGTRLGSLKGLALRPTLDRVRESFFNQVSPVIEGQIRRLSLPAYRATTLRVEDGGPSGAR